MLARSQALRWSGKGISNGRQRLSTANSARNYSSIVLRSQRVSPTYSRTRSHLQVLPQTRAISFFGWGSSKPSSDQLPTTPTDASPVQSTSSPIDQLRTVRASHATSDTPDPSLTQSIPPQSGEPAVLRDIENAISTPQGADLSTDIDIYSIPERVGYLKEVCGLDFGWGPTAFMQYCFEACHIYTGLPWATSIIVVALAVRIAIFPTVYKAQENAAKMKEAQKYMEPLRAEYKKAVAMQDKQQMMRVGVEMKEMLRTSGVKISDGFKPLLYQIPLQFGAFRGLRAAGDLPVPAFETESFYWISNLAMSDPWILPSVTALSAYLLATRAMKAGTISPSQQTMMIVFKYVLPIGSFFFVRWQAAPLQIFFAASSLFTMIQQNALITDSIRQRIGLSPMNPASTTSGGSPDKPTGPPGGMRTRSSTVIDIKAREVPEGVQQNVSAPDKFVDSVKSQWGSVTQVARDKYNERTEKKKKDAADHELERHEYRRRQDAQDTMRHRNRHASQSSAYQESEIGGMKTRR